MKRLSDYDISVLSQGNTGTHNPNRGSSKKSNNSFVLNSSTKHVNYVLNNNSIQQIIPEKELVQKCFDNSIQYLAQDERQNQIHYSQMGSQTKVKQRKVSNPAIRTNRALNSSMDDYLNQSLEKSAEHKQVHDQSKILGNPCKSCFYSKINRFQSQSKNETPGIGAYNCDTSTFRLKNSNNLSSPFVSQQKRQQSVLADIIKSCIQQNAEKQKQKKLE